MQNAYSAPEPNSIYPRMLKWLITFLFAINVGIALASFGVWILAAVQGLLWRADFSAFYTAWAMVRDGLGSHLYDLELQTSYQQAILESRSFASGLLTFNYPPHTALVFMPFAYLPLPWAYFVWSLGQLGLLIWLMKRLLFLSSHWSGAERIILLCTVLAFSPLLETFLKGTFSLFLLCCMVEFYFSLLRGKSIYSGIWLVLASFKPQSLALPGLLLLAGKQWKSILAAGAGAVLIFLATSLCWGWRTWLDFLEILLTSSSRPDWPGITLTDMYNIKGLLATFLGANQFQLISVISMALFIASGLATLWLWRGKWQIAQPSFDLRMAVTLSLGLVASLHLNSHDGLQVILPAVLLYNQLRSKSRPRLTFGLGVLSAPIVFFFSSFASVGGNILPSFVFNRRFGLEHLGAIACLRKKLGGTHLLICSGR